MSKGILSLGCSFSWGESLYFYSDLENLPFHKTHEFDREKLRESMILYKDVFKFSRLVSNHLNTWEYQPSKINGGNNFNSITNFDNRIEEGDFILSDFGLVIWQLTEPLRDLPDIQEYAYHLSVLKNETYNLDIQHQEFLKLESNQIEQTLNYINRRCSEFEKNGIKVLTIVWPEEIYNHKKYKEYFEERHTPIFVDGDKFNSFSEVINLDIKSNSKYNITVKSDFARVGLQTADIHFNKKGHRCVADSIIKKLEQDNFNHTNLRKSKNTI